MSRACPGGSTGTAAVEGAARPRAGPPCGLPGQATALSLSKAKEAFFIHLSLVEQVYEKK
jgi:hypothetical protein